MGYIEVAPAIAVAALGLRFPAVAALHVAHVTTARNRYGLLRRVIPIGARYRPRKTTMPRGVRTAAMGPAFCRRQSAPRMRPDAISRPCATPCARSCAARRRGAIPAPAVRHRGPFVGTTEG